MLPADLGFSCPNSLCDSTGGLYTKPHVPLDSLFPPCKLLGASREGTRREQGGNRESIETLQLFFATFPVNSRSSPRDSLWTPCGLPVDSQKHRESRWSPTMD